MSLRYEVPQLGPEEVQDYLTELYQAQFDSTAGSVRTWDLHPLAVSAADAALAAGVPVDAILDTVNYANKMGQVVKGLTKK